MIRSTLPLVLALTAVPAFAQDWSMVEFTARGLKKDDPVQLYRGAVAACLAGQGDAAKTAAIFTDAGWSLTTEAEMGLNEFAGPDENHYVLAATDGSFCAAYSEIQGTDAALGNVQIVAGIGGLALDDAVSDMGCIALQLAPGIIAEVTSSGNDPVCTDATTSQVRFTFGDGQ